MANKKEYTNEDIVSLKGEDRVRKRPAVIFGSDGLEGCKHSVFEILSNSIDEARDGHGDKIIVTKYNDDSIELRTSDVVVLLTITSVRKNITGSLFTASFMQAASIIITAEITMNIRWVLTDWVLVRRSIPLSLWTLRFSVTDISMTCTLKREEMLAVLKRKRPSRKRQVQRHTGDLILKFSRILKLRTNILRTF